MVDRFVMKCALHLLSGLGWEAGMKACTSLEVGTCITSTTNSEDMHLSSIALRDKGLSKETYVLVSWLLHHGNPCTPRVEIHCYL